MIFRSKSAVVQIFHRKHGTVTKRIALIFLVALHYVPSDVKVSEPVNFFTNMQIQWTSERTNELVNQWTSEPVNHLPGMLVASPIYFYC